jgi:hypothetical protein
MDGKTMLMNCPQNIKDIIIEKFGSLEDFYGFVYQLNIKQYADFKKTHKFDNAQIDRLKVYLEKVGVDFMIADDLVEEIGCDFSELVAENYLKIYLGDNWKEKIEKFDKLISQY